MPGESRGEESPGRAGYRLYGSRGSAMARRNILHYGIHARHWRCSSQRARAPIFADHVAEILPAWGRLIC